MQFISSQQIDQFLKHADLVPALKRAFASDITTPMRQHFDIPNPFSSRETTLLMMPSWQSGQDIGIKLVTVTPDSAQYQLPSIQGVYVLFDGVKGCVKALLDAPALTAKRTAAASALGSQFMSRTDSGSLLMVGTGTLAPEIIQAHASVRPIRKVSVWGRDPKKAEKLCQDLSHLDLEIKVVTELSKAVPEVDIVSCATLSQTPLIQGQWLVPGQHLDLIGAYRPDMREADDDCIRRCRIVVDNYAGACKETGDILIPMEQGILTKEQLEGDLFGLCSGQDNFERVPEDITLFKSVGHALEDLAAAQLLFQQREVNHEQSR